MGTHYEVGVGADLTSFVRVFFVDATNTPVSGLVVPFIVRDVTGAAILAGALTDLAGAPGWYDLPSFVLGFAGIYTVEYAPPFGSGFPSDADSILAVVGGGGGGTGLADNRFIYGGLGIIDADFVFSALFTNGANAPITVTNPTIHTFYYNTTTGAKVTVTPAGTALPLSTPGETGRYSYTETIPAALSGGELFYAEMEGVDPAFGGLGLIKIDVVLTAVAASAISGSTGGFFSNFVKGG